MVTTANVPVPEPLSVLGVRAKFYAVQTKGIAYHQKVSRFDGRQWERI